MDCASAGSPPKQDMPPPGGFKRIPYQRVPAKTYFSGFQMFAAYTVVTTVSYYLYYLNAKRVECENVEMRSAQNVITALMLAERDREFLKQLRRNRDEEAQLMSNVPGWEVGTWYGEPVYKTLPKDTLVTPLFKEFYCHTSPEEFKKRAFFKLWT